MTLLIIAAYQGYEQTHTAHFFNFSADYGAKMAVDKLSGMYLIIEIWIQFQPKMLRIWVNAAIFA